MSLSALTLGVFKNDVFSALDLPIAPSTHPSTRARLRHWILARLRAAALQPSRIAATRATPTALSSLPRVFLYTLREPDPEAFAESPTILGRSIDLALHAVVAADALPPGAELDDVIDAFAEAFERVLLCDVDAHGRFFGGEATDCALRATDVEPEQAGERVVLHIRVAFRVSYQRVVERPVSGVLAAIDADWDLGPLPDGQLEAEDRIAFPVVGELDAVFSLDGDMVGSVVP